MTYEEKVITISDKEYDYVYCPECEVWIEAKKFNFKTGEHEGCEKLQKSKDIRRRAEKIAIGGRRIKRSK